ncbi:hypothetical protein KKJ09_19005 [Xenorhabdus bovienii]|uniref:hypothetical protein n=1 Tax=Xenorhabdus bovienii TaxID=40576 RepID=UPI0023B21BAF|nr:hypothetical protein [Xenorhabdus bovienii]MDE9495616.1 hypothetical protein [Xenorhabdus bovienii]MDE9504033.1 hypothetical protein [Xenorhabdus bovienii]MDE9528045.1 hypothetical protein [Xenorhabdus bovienii]
MKKDKEISGHEIDVEIKELSLEEVKNILTEQTNSAEEVVNDRIGERGTTQRIYIDIYNETSKNFVLTKNNVYQGKWEIRPKIKLPAGGYVRSCNIGSAFSGPKGLLRYETFNDEFCEVFWYWAHTSQFEYRVDSGPNTISTENRKEMNSGKNYITITVRIRDNR